MTRTDGNSGFGTLFSTAAALTAPVQDMPSRPFNGGVPVRPEGRPWIKRAVDTVLTWHERARERRQLMQLIDRMLSDIGISRAEASGEAEKPFWRA